MGAGGDKTMPDRNLIRAFAEHHNVPDPFKNVDSTTLGAMQTLPVTPQRAVNRRA